MNTVASLPAPIAVSSVLKAIEPTGDVKRDWEIISLLASEMGYPMQYQNNQQIWDEMRELCPLFYGVTYEKMGEMGHVQWPCADLDSPGTPYLYAHSQFDTANGKGKLFAAPWRAPAKFLMNNIRWCCVPCVRLGTTPAVR